MRQITVAFAKEDAEKSRQQEVRFIELMMSNNQPRAEAPQFQNHGMQSHQNVLYGQTQVYQSNSDAKSGVWTNKLAVE